MKRTQCVSLTDVWSVSDEEAAGHHVQPGQTDAAGHSPEGNILFFFLEKIIYRK